VTMITRVCMSCGSLLMASSTCRPSSAPGIITSSTMRSGLSSWAWRIPSSPYDATTVSRPPTSRRLTSAIMRISSSSSTISTFFSICTPRRRHSDVSPHRSQTSVRAPHLAQSLAQPQRRLSRVACISSGVYLVRTVLAQNDRASHSERTSSIAPGIASWFGMPIRLGSGSPTSFGPTLYLLVLADAVPPPRTAAVRVAETNTELTSSCFQSRR